MERHIGEVFDFKGKQYMVERASSFCDGCSFRDSDAKCCNNYRENTGSCSNEFRTDKTDVIFIFTGVTNPEPKPTESKKNDIIDNKVRMDLLPWPELEEIAKVYTAGAKKYGENQWQDLPDGYARYKGAMLRHLTELEKGNEIDEETGCMHAAQVAWNAIAMLHFRMKNKENK